MLGKSKMEFSQKQLERLQKELEISDEKEKNENISMLHENQADLKVNFSCDTNSGCHSEIDSKNDFQLKKIINQSH